MTDMTGDRPGKKRGKQVQWQRTQCHDEKVLTFGKQMSPCMGGEGCTHGFCMTVVV